ncbi:MAG: YgcG family protein [Xanthobacteraceae bacterium]
MTAYFLLALCLFTSVAFALDFPQLTGRVVDQAGVMSADSRGAIEAKLKDLEDQSGIQLVVTTVKSLQGSDIETYANQLFRTWKLGQSQKNNGVLLLVAPAEHKVRIEVGYGLEGTLTDALSSVIISSAVVPCFKANDYSGGIERGVDGIISVLKGDTTDWQPKVSVRTDDDSTSSATLLIVLFVLFFIYFLWLSRNSGTSGRYGSGGTFFPPMGGSSWGSSGGDSGGFSGGFSGGGGSSGGGGASGSW